MKAVRESAAHQVVTHPDYGMKLALNPDKHYADNDPLVLAFPQFFVDVVPEPTTAEPAKPKRKAARSS